MEEKLTCTVCTKDWFRPKTRGRKPILCPTCLKAGVTFVPVVQQPVQPQQNQTTSSSNEDITPGLVHKYLYPKPSNYKDLVESTKKGSKWKCPSCGYILKLDIAVTAVPTHRCTPDTVSVKLFERIS